MLERINAVLTEGFRVVDFHILPEANSNVRAASAMSLLASADYLVSLKDGYSAEGISSGQEFKEAFLAFYGSEEIIIDKKTKTTQKEVNIKPMISLLAFDEEEYISRLKPLLEVDLEENRNESCADIYNNGIKLYMQLDTGSSSNLKPELVMEAFFNRQGYEFNKFAWQVHRLEMYARDDKGRKLTPLYAMER